MDSFTSITFLVNFLGRKLYYSKLFAVLKNIKQEFIDE